MNLRSGVHTVQTCVKSAELVLNCECVIQSSVAFNVHIGTLCCVPATGTARTRTIRINI